VIGDTELESRQKDKEMRSQVTTGMNHGRAAFAAVFGLASIGLPSHALASQSARLVYARAVEASSCGDESLLRGAVARRLGYDPFVAVSDNTVVAELRGDGDGLRARVFVIEHGSTVGGARELTSKSKDCDELVLAVALAISIAIDPESIDRVVEEPSEPAAKPKVADIPPEPVAETKPAPSARTPAQAPLQPTVPIVVRSALGGFVATGPIPAPSYGLVAGLGFERSLMSVEIEPRWWAPIKTPAQPNSGARATVNLISITLAPCLSHLGWYGCYLVELGRLASEGEVLRPKRDISTWVGQGLRLAYRLGKARGFGLAVKIDGLYALTHVGMTLNDTKVYDTPRFSGRLGLELSYAL
jgi:hypothetical protein